MNLSKIYKRGQAKYTRLGTALSAFVILVIGCWRLHDKLQLLNNLWFETLVPAGVCLAGAGVIFWILNKPSVSDFLISSEGEIKKVSWSNRRELFTSTMVVIFVVLAFAAGLVIIDLLLSLFFRVIVKLY